MRQFGTVKEDAVKLKLTDGELHVPGSVLADAGFDREDTAVVETTNEGVLVRRATPAETVEADIAAGRNSYFDSDGELDAALAARMKPRDDAG